MMRLQFLRLVRNAMMHVHGTTYKRHIDVRVGHGCASGRRSSIGSHSDLRTRLALLAPHAYDLCVTQPPRRMRMRNRKGRPAVDTTAPSSPKESGPDAQPPPCARIPAEDAELVRQVLARVGDKWSLLVIATL